MTANPEAPVTYRPAEAHPFQAGGSEFLYLVPSGAIFRMEGLPKAALDLVREREHTRDELIGAMLQQGFSAEEVETALDELEQAEVLASNRSKPAVPEMPMQEFPLQRVVLNVTNQCNLACTYCYEYSEDKITEPQGKPKYMTKDVAESAIEMLIRESSGRKSIHVTFFGGETLLNFPVMRSTVEFAKKKAAEVGKEIEFSLTTNATLLNEEIIQFLSDQRIGVTVSIDGDKELNDKMRVFHDGRGSYEIIAPKIKQLLKGHRTNSIGARVTLTSGVTNVPRIFRHLTTELGFDAVGFSPATASPDRLYSIGPQKMDHVLGGFAELAMEYRDHAIEGRQHGFTNVSDTLKELHSGISKAYPCGAGLGLLGVSTGGDIGLCHRFVDSPEGKMGHLNEGGIDHDARREFLTTHHIGARYDCHTCWARPVCAGGCYHEAFIHYGDTSAANLHYCDWIRGWNDLCLQIYGEISVRNPSFLNRFNEN
ncbi:MAG TPA: quinohemoprotein amine dehydrogenase maturation protein [Bryobacteraceae bacterium]|nr:quinohemoprotein amine dehydrogenase maturation protein [Bryobacteraceae bacterium]